jgi:hypothetical protein
MDRDEVFWNDHDLDWNDHDLQWYSQAIRRLFEQVDQEELERVLEDFTAPSSSEDLTPSNSSKPV